MWIYRIKYAKHGRIRFTSHLDVMRALTRALNRAGIPVAYSEGFNPHQKLSMGPALPLGYESACEIADITVTRMLTPQQLHERLAPSMPAGLDLLDTAWVLANSPRLSDATSACYMIRLDDREIADNAAALVREFLAKESVLVERIRKEGNSVVNIKQCVADTRLEDRADFRWLRVQITMGGQRTCSASEVARAVLKLLPERAKCLRIMRTDIRFDGRPRQVRKHEEIQEEGNRKGK